MRSYTAEQMSDTFTGVKGNQRKINVKFFEMVLLSTREGGHYIYPAVRKTFTIKNGKFWE